MPKFLVPIDLNKNELQNYVVQNLAAAPSSPKKGQTYFNTTDNRKYTWNGTEWIANDGLGATMTGDDIVVAINGSSSVIDFDNLNVNKSDIGLGNVTNDAQIKKSVSSVDGNIPTWNGSTGDSLNSGYSVETTLTGSTGAIPRADAVKSYIDNVLSANDAMIFKGTLGTSGTITALPTTYQTGWTYKVITAGTYANKACEVGDLIIAIVDRTGTGNLDSDWTVVQTNIDGAVTGPSSATDGNLVVFDGPTGKLIKDSTYNLSSFTRKYSQAIGNGTNTSFVITHNLNSRAVTVSIAETSSPYEVVYALIELTSVNSITVSFAEAPTSNQYTVTVIG